MEFDLQSEFASVSVELVEEETGDSPRLRITDKLRDRESELDYEDLARLTRYRTGDLDEFLPY